MSQSHSCDFSYKIPYFETPIEGSTHFDIGQCIGKQFKHLITEYLTRSDLPFQSIYLPYVLSKRNDQNIQEHDESRIELEATASLDDNYSLLRPWIQLVDQCFPKYVQEIRGLAAGSEQPFEWLFILNMLNELRSKILHDERVKEKKTTKVGGCSEVFVCCKTSEKEISLIAHNEDADKSMGEYSYIVKSNYLQDDGSIKSMVAYHYPGTIGGNTFGWNEFLVFGTNGKSPKKTLTETCGIPRCFINRYIYESTNIEEVYSKLEEYALLSSSGFSTNVSTRFIVNDDFYQMANIELAPSLDGNTKQISKYDVPVKRNSSEQPQYVHTNHYVHLLNIPEEEVPSSRNRYARALCHSNIISENDIIQLLGDTEDKEYPIFRTVNHPDKGKTLATFIVNLIEQTAKVYVGNPIHTEPLYTMKLF